MPFPDTLLFVSNPPAVLSNRTDTGRRNTTFPLPPIDRRSTITNSTTASTLSDEEQTFLCPSFSSAGPSMTKRCRSSTPRPFSSSSHSTCGQPICSLRGIGAGRRIHFIRLSVESSSSSITLCVRTWTVRRDMRAVCRSARGCETSGHSGDSPAENV